MKHKKVIIGSLWCHKTRGIDDQLLVWDVSSEDLVFSIRICCLQSGEKFTNFNDKAALKLVLTQYEELQCAKTK
jgi:hypothetical protein